MQALSNTAWGFSKLLVCEERLLKAIAAQALQRLPQFRPQNTANLVRTPHVLTFF